MLDRYLYGKVSRISPEAPVPVLEWGHEENRLGGAANVAMNVRMLGAYPVLCGMTGQDADSSILLELMPANGLDDSGIVASPHRMTTVKTRVISGTQQLLRLDKEQTHDLSAEEEEKFLDTVVGLLDNTDFQVIILQDYNKGVLTERVIKCLISEAKKRHIPVTVDPKSKNFWNFKGVDLFKPNLKEVRDALNFFVESDEKSLRHASGLLRSRLDNHFTLITLSEKGLYLDDKEQGRTFPTHRRNVADVCGAGDTVISIASLALAAGMSKEEIALLSNLAGGQVVEKVGVVPVDKTQLEKEILQTLIGTQ